MFIESGSRSYVPAKVYRVVLITNATAVGSILVSLARRSPPPAAAAGSGFVSLSLLKTDLVTCIGQVRVKTKKQSKKMVTRSLSRRRSACGEVLNFKRLEREISDSTNNGDSMISGGGGSGSGGGIQFQQYECLPPERNQR
ncbi:hypothetical protein LINPERPRIM_LOCUS33410 [Linum perenne]